MHPEPEIITYSLRGPDGTSDEFYRDLAAFADRVASFVRWASEEPTKVRANAVKLATMISGLNELLSKFEEAIGD